MGIDVYLRWPKQTGEEEDAQYCGFRIDAGNVGYLRESYHGGPYATRVLIPEGWDENNNGAVPITAAELRKRLPAVVLTSLYRNFIVYKQGEDHINCGNGGTDTLARKLADVFATMRVKSHKELRWTEEQIKQAQELIEKRKLPDYALSFVDFVRLAETKEAETGELCSVLVSY